MDELGKIAYEAYCASTGGRSLVSGAQLPVWEQQAQEIRAAWNAAAAAVEVKRVDTGSCRCGR